MAPENSVDAAEMNRPFEPCVTVPEPASDLMDAVPTGAEMSNVPSTVTTLEIRDAAASVERQGRAQVDRGGAGVGVGAGQRQDAGASLDDGTASR